MTIIVGMIDLLIGAVFLTGGPAGGAVGAVGAWRSARPARWSRHRESASTAELLTIAWTGPSLQTHPGRGWTTFCIHFVLAAASCILLALTVSAGRSGRLSSGSVFTVMAAYVQLVHNKIVSVGRRVDRARRALADAERRGRQAGGSALAGVPGEHAVTARRS